MNLENNMNEPNKVYLAFKRGCVVQSANVSTDANGNSIFLDGYNPLEFVNKKALIEWADGMVQDYAEMHERYPDNMVYVGQQKAFQALINKLNTM